MKAKDSFYLELRLAVPTDLSRISIVAASGFRYSPAFRWERPHHLDFPQDTLLSYQTQSKSAMQDIDTAVIVAEDNYQPNESNATETIIPSENDWIAPAKGSKVIVGVATLKLEPASQRRGQFRDPGGPW